MLFSCSKCGKIHDKSFKCKGSSSIPKTNEQALRAKYKWTKKSRDIRERSYHLCAICKALGDYSPKEVEVHHIIKIRDDSNLLLEDSNLITLCIDHHKKADRGEYDVEELRKLAKLRDND